jgi:hypothetical protein
MNRLMQTEREAEVRVIGMDDGSIELSCLSTNQQTWVTLTPDERDQLVAWLLRPTEPLIRTGERF